ncbi:GNAT family N-acetyltransferase [Mycoplasmopsis fermentans]|uniref:N-acetyltransferase domain-containing protein n=2 Tax=Mycoplasmopsis fermentans TaxID=2115 RepID=C4XER9_MYCFP|nr:GNAT family N-acetyltransferase [Mycoplasmopsis fermentans]VEU67507.1 ribosomal-protein-alanine acetyltransferase [Mesomycoplasma conjunctivae]ADN68919.1 putative GCN5-related N-acetyltransferase [Mycoplasmopsis fermentans JER]ADV34342.1 GCN5-related N-acetyltransferase [Mycoplasmopsis fermentans M64]RMX35829.1 acetyltransferase family protein [Mycoplasmopsis fermentans MF-I2]RMX35891.1 acetyltransferase family protein [Mycoplasmopsis fermentans MF-I1]
MKIVKLTKKEYKGKEFCVQYKTKGYYFIEHTKNGFSFVYKKFDQEKTFGYCDKFFQDWLNKPICYGALDDHNKLLGFAEGYLEEWNNRFRITNILVFDENSRHSGIGSKLMKKMIAKAKTTPARMIVLETETCNEKAIRFYQKFNFEVIGFDLYAYTNEDPKEHEVRVEMGLKI